MYLCVCVYSEFNNGNSYAYVQVPVCFILCSLYLFLSVKSSLFFVCMCSSSWDRSETFSGMVGIDGPFICQGTFHVRLPTEAMKSIQTSSGSVSPGRATSPAPTPHSRALSAITPSGAGSAAPVTMTLTPGITKSPRPQSPTPVSLSFGMQEFAAFINEDEFMTLPQIQNAVNYIKFADVLLAPFSTPQQQSSDSLEQPVDGPTSARPAGVSVYQCQNSDLWEVSQALELIIRAWRILAHQPVDSMFPNRVNASNASVFNPPLPQDVLIEAAVASGEIVLHLFVFFFAMLCI